MESLRIKELSDYIKSIDINIGDKMYETISNCIDLLHQVNPLDNAGVFSKLSRLTSASDDLEWVVISIRRIRNDFEIDLRKLKDPKFTVLVRSGRPSTQAIESEIRFTTPQINELESKINVLLNVEEYLVHIEKNIDRMIWTLKDLSQYIRK